MFIDRKDAGIKLAKALNKYKARNILVLAIPRGGVEVGFEVAKYLNSDFDILISRKLPIPDNSEAGFGAIAEDGSIYLDERASSWISETEFERIKSEQLNEIKRRIKVLRNNRPLQEVKNRIVILIDDGLAMGSTMKASIQFCRNNNAKEIVVAVPVAGQDTLEDIKRLVDEIIVLEVPYYFKAVAQIYLNWHDVTDQEVIEIMNKWALYKDKNRN
ncbi:MAG: phosphoribosyltransferase [Nitrososphaeraceae archaeon]